MKRLSWSGMKAVVLFLCVLWVLMVLGTLAHNGKNGFQVLFEVLKHAERVLNKTGRERYPLKKPPYRKPGGFVTVPNGMASVTRNNNGQPHTVLLCFYYNVGKYGSFAESLGGHSWFSLHTWGSEPWRKTPVPFSKPAPTPAAAAGRLTP
ncbi:hypothetical protein, unlikely [Trypanosoma congolense IL3000]|uniref:Uncharacterized protein n=1 Tax=Trypanosoma congolense (strain IL3000) TaxID=1068625 RepID=F9WIP0_TRYCI|nr:hypothetical protein, unlikely [Trypanosoma congolense IL3000]CCD14767.1 hypothetical protein, unlikely [Trypanosoma congolense IL3000]CCD15197.1 hypothetical protein, unlikely [Trypanosoma congolense IL3000]CCD17188.1 hypothetical protein, unlikely [Trypanosoma congolense IL3000]